jgi:hypothetical protein
MSLCQELAIDISWPVGSTVGAARSHGPDRTSRCLKNYPIRLLFKRCRELSPGPETKSGMVARDSRSASDTSNRFRPAGPRCPHDFVEPGSVKTIIAQFKGGFMMADIGSPLMAAEFSSQLSSNTAAGPTPPQCSIGRRKAAGAARGVRSASPCPCLAIDCARRRWNSHRRPTGNHRDRCPAAGNCGIEMA